MINKCTTGKAVCCKQYKTDIWRFALDPKGKPIGVAINNACHSSEMDQTCEEVCYFKLRQNNQQSFILTQLLAECLDPSYRPIVAIHHKLRWGDRGWLVGLDIFPDRQQNKYIYDELQTDKFFSIRMVGVENSNRGMGVATELIRRLTLQTDR